MKYRALIVVAALILISVLAGCGETTTPERLDTATSSEKSGQKPQAPETFAIGEPINMGDLVLTVNGVRESKGDQYIKPKEGHIYKIVEATLENIGQESAAISSLMMFSLTDSEGYKYTVTIGPDTKGSLDGELQPGRKMRGELVFEVPTEAAGLELLFEPNVLGFGQAIISLE